MKTPLIVFMMTLLCQAVSAAPLTPELYVKVKSELLQEDIRHLQFVLSALADKNIAKTPIYNEEFLTNQKSSEAILAGYGLSLKDYYDFAINHKADIEHWLAEAKQDARRLAKLEKIKQVLLINNSARIQLNVPRSKGVE